MTLGVGVVGLGVGEAHARAYAAMPECRLRWIHDLDADRARRSSAEFPDAAVAVDYDEVLADPAVHIVSIASYDDAHFEQVAKALRAGKHVFVEKPLCRSVEQLGILKSLRERTGVHLSSNLILRAAPLYQWLKDAVAAGRLGTVYAVDGDYLYGRLEKITGGWRGRAPDYSVLLGGGVHLIDLLLWLTGELPNRVAGAGNRVCTAGTSFNYDDYQAATFQFPSSLVGRISANFGCMHPHQHVVRVFGTRGTFIHDDCGARVFAARDGGPDAERLDLAARAPTKGELIPAFVARILGGVDAGATAQHEFNVISACAAADRAANLGEPTDVAYV